MRSRHAVVREFLSQERVSMLCLVETKVNVLYPSMISDLMGMSFDYALLPAIGALGGVLVAWNREDWSSPSQVVGQFSVTVHLIPVGVHSSPWSLSAFYGPVDEALKPAFLDELRHTHSSSAEPLLLCGDFNLIYRAEDKSNDRLNLRSMRRFRRALDNMQVDELYLHGRLYNWSNEWRRPTMERIDRAFGMVAWLEAFPDHHLRCLSSDCSDHAPLLLQLRSTSWAKPRFRFEPFWVRLDGFHDIVARA